MTPTERLTIYKKLCLHPKYLSLPEKLQHRLSLMAAGYTDWELSKKFKISHGTPWSYRESIFKRLGYKVYEPDRVNKHTYGPTRAMNMEEIKIKLRI